MKEKQQPRRATECYAPKCYGTQPGRRFVKLAIAVNAALSNYRSGVVANAR